MPGQFLFIGVGGSGAKTLRATKEELRRSLSLTKEGQKYLKEKGFPKIWQFKSSMPKCCLQMNILE